MWGSGVERRTDKIYWSDNASTDDVNYVLCSYFMSSKIKDLAKAINDIVKGTERAVEDVGLVQRKGRRTRKNKNKNKNNRAYAYAGGMATTSAPASYSTQVVTRPPRVTGVVGAKSVRIKHRELIDSALSGSTGFTLQYLTRLNPGLSNPFVWMSAIAQRYEQYRCHALRICFVSTSPSGAKGEVILVPVYDVSDPAPSSETNAVNNVGAVATQVWQNSCCTYDPATMMGIGPRKYVRATNVQGDPRTYDVGALYIYTSGCADTSAVGKIYVEYDFEFFSPQSDLSPTVPVIQGTTCININGTFAMTTSVGYIIGNSIPNSNNTLNFVCDALGFGPGNSGVMTPPAGAYNIWFSFDGSDNTTEPCQYEIDCFKNLANVEDAFGVTSASGQICSPVAYTTLTCNGTDTISFRVKATGAAGTLTNLGVSIVITLA